nr:hypothetical protein [Rhodoferax sp.]
MHGQKSNVTTAAVLSLCLLAGCSKGPDKAALNAGVQEYWGDCKVVKAGPISVESSKGSKVRFNYKVTLSKNGAAVQPAECPAKNWTMLQAVANEDFPKMKAGAEVSITVERDTKSGADIIIMQGLFQ